MVATLYINGLWREASDGGSHDVQSPHDQSVVATVSQASQTDVLDAIAAARASFDSGVFTSWSFKERSELVAKIADLLERDADVIARKESDDTGKRFIEAQYDVADVVATFRHFASLGAKEHGRSVDVGIAHVSSRIVHEPLGVASLIGPWNYPLLQIAWKVAPALAAGCSFIIKPSELTPQSAIALTKIIEEAGTPKGVANLILGPGSVVGSSLISDPRVDLVSFTGGLTTGQTIMKAAATTIKKLALELGGKNPHIIFADADLDAAIDNAVTAAFLHSGQVCSAGTRLIVERSVHDRVVTEIVHRAGKIKLGGPNDESAETGPLISKSHLANVSTYVEKAIAEGATLLIGGERSDKAEHAKGWYFLPTVFDNCTSDMSCVQDESFGPIMTVEIFDTEAQAIAIGNDTVFGLSGGLWSGDSQKCARVASALRHGTIWVNDFGPYRPAAEWGGYKQSGIGRELGEHGLGEYLEIKHIWTNNAPSRSGWFKDL
ncbi:MAG: aldehyde dehydrogenase family protein [Candidatus Planktophila sp.]|nr:aldehyde dehydrogenase family protein [Candidatus Planktophila sp.]